MQRSLIRTQDLLVDGNDYKGGKNMEFRANVNLDFIAQYVSDRLYNFWKFPDEVCDGFYDYIESLGYFEGNPDAIIDNCYCNCQYVRFDECKELEGLEIDKNDYQKLSGIFDKEVLFVTDDYIVFDWAW